MKPFALFGLVLTASACSQPVEIDASMMDAMLDASGETTVSLPDVTASEMHTVQDVAAVDTPPPAPGTLTGTVMSPQRGALGSVMVTAFPGHSMAITTPGTGTYAIANIIPGALMVSVST